MPAGPVMSRLNPAGSLGGRSMSPPRPRAPRTLRWAHARCRHTKVVTPRYEAEVGAFARTGAACGSAGSAGGTFRGPAGSPPGLETAAPPPAQAPRRPPFSFVMAAHPFRRALAARPALLPVLPLQRRRLASSRLRFGRLRSAAMVGMAAVSEWSGRCPLTARTRVRIPAGRSLFSGVPHAPEGFAELQQRDGEIFLRLLHGPAHQDSPYPLREHLRG
jgi:hypothetical protein